MLIRNVIVAGRGRCNVLLRAGRIVDFPQACLADVAIIEGRGGRLLPGLHDPHLHLLGAVAATRSIDARGLSRDELARRIDAAARRGAVRVTGYPGEDRELLDARALDALCRDVPLRLQYRTGGLWVLNSAALDELRADAALQAPEFERGANGHLTGRVWRGDRWLRNGVPDVAAVERFGLELARHGITSITDASATTDAIQAAVIATAASRLPQRLTLMSADALPRDPRYRIGPVKILLDDAALPDLDVLIARFERARARERRIAVHCVTHAELALALAAFQTVGSLPGDRIEHGALIGADSIPVLAGLGLTVVTQPAFVHAHGDRYLRAVPADEHADLYRLRSLIDGGVNVLFSSDAPYGPANPWLALHAAQTRRTRDGAPLGPREALATDIALRHLSHESRVERGAPADLCLLAPFTDERADDPVERTLIGGREVYVRDRPAGPHPLADRHPPFPSMQPEAP